MKKSVILCVLDGWGESSKTEGNAIALAKTPNFNNLLLQNQKSTLIASGCEVGLPEGQFGNSEVGHLHIGAGRIVEQGLQKINSAIAKNEISENSKLQEFALQLQKNRKACHIVGIASDGGVHGHYSHILHMIEVLTKYDLNIFLHLFTDGRDSSIDHGKKCIEKIANYIMKFPQVRIATICGRYYAMDRDNNWTRTKQSYDVITFGTNEFGFGDPAQYLSDNYSKQIYDEFIPPMASNKYLGIFVGDGLLVTHYRSDRMRQLLNSFFSRTLASGMTNKRFASALGMTSYSHVLDNHIGNLFTTQLIKNSLGEIISQQGLNQLRLAETEKYAHVTYFFNGGEETPFAKEERTIIPSQRVKTYDIVPEMSANLITEELCKIITQKKYQLIVVNYANADMVGHTGNLNATIQAIQCIDRNLGLVSQYAKDNGYDFVVTSDHGNADQMLKENAQINTAHTLNPVPFLLQSEKKYSLKQHGTLIDIAPTILDLMGIEIPPEMHGKSLILEILQK